VKSEVRLWQHILQYDDTAGGVNEPLGQNSWCFGSHSATGLATWNRGPKTSPIDRLDCGEVEWIVWDVAVPRFPFQQTGVIRLKKAIVSPTPMSKARVVCSLILLTMLSAGRARADEWESPTNREFLSNNGKYVFAVTPHKDWPDKPGHCLGVLFRVDAKNRTEIWSRYLINDVSPVDVFVADSGKFVVTMDEWHEVGTLPVVIYDFRGGLVHVHSTDTLGLKNDILHIEQTVSSYWWNKDSVSFFGPEDKTFVIRVHWGKTLFLWLQDGALMDDEWHRVHQDWLIPKREWLAIHDFADKQIRKNGRALLDSKDASERKTGALICGQERITWAIPRLKELLKDDEYYMCTSSLISWTRVYYVRKAARDALKLMGEKVEGVIVEEETGPLWK
jgi:hypothetical protein